MVTWYWSTDTLFWRVIVHIHVSKKYMANTNALSTIIWGIQATMLRDSVARRPSPVVRTRTRTVPLAMITMRKSTHGLPFLFHEYGAPLGSSSGRRSSAIKILVHNTKEKFKPTDLIASYIWFDFWFDFISMIRQMQEWTTKQVRAIWRRNLVKELRTEAQEAFMHVAAAWQILGYSFRKSVN